MKRRAFLVTVAASAAALALVAATPAWARGDGQEEGQGGKGRGKDGEKGGEKGGDKGGEKGGGKDGEKGGEKPGEKAGEKAGPKEKDPKDAPEWKECAAIGAEFAAKKSKSLVARLRPGGKLDVKLGEKSTGRYAADQAAEVLDAWFQSKGSLTVKLRSVKDLVASFDLTVRRAGSDREVTHQLYVEIRKREKGEGFHLVRLEKA